MTDNVKLGEYELPRGNGSSTWALQCKQTEGRTWRWKRGFNWRKLTGVLCEKRVPLRVKSNIYKSMVLPAMVYSMGTAVITKSQERKLMVMEMKVLRFMLGITRLDRAKNEEVRKKLNTGEVSTKSREVRLRWAGHVWRREESYVGQRMMGMLMGIRRRGRPKRRWKNNIKEDMTALGSGGGGYPGQSQVEKLYPHRRPCMSEIKAVEEKEKTRDCQ